jgi:hypothetical protein
MDIRIADSWDLMALPLVPSLVGTGAQALETFFESPTTT